MPLITLPEIRAVAKLALPLMAAFLAQKGMQLVDTVMMGWIGPDALAAGALTLVTFMTLIVFCIGTLSAVGIFCAHARGANTLLGVTTALQNGLCLALLLALPLMLIVWHIPTLLLATGQVPIVVHNSQLLLHSIVWGVPGYLLFFVGREFVSAFSLTRVVMLINFISLPITFAANYVLIYGKYGFPALGIQGIGIASASVMWLMFFSLLVYCLKHHVLKPYVHQLFAVKISYQKIKDMLRVGIPSGILFILDMSMFTVATLMIGQFGADDLAAYQIAVQCAAVVYTVAFALSMTTSILVSHSVGSNNIPAARRYAGFCYAVSFIFSASIALTFMLIPDTFVRLFLSLDVSGSDLVRQRADTFLEIAAWFVCFDAVLAIAIGILKGFKDTFMPMLLSVGGYWILGIGGGYFLAFHTPLGVEGVWYGLILGIFSVAVILTARCVQRFRREIVRVNNSSVRYKNAV